jgi:tRNA pseudouridine55 synthase
MNPVPRGNSAANRQAPPSVNGFLNLYKPVGISSMDALRQVKRLTGQRRKVGHAGTMDPLARGVLPVCFGQATRLMECVVDGNKLYRMVVRLGATTQTYDSEGEPEPVRDPDYVTEEMVAEACRPFIGAIDQKPPMFSAVKVDGQRLYKLARAGVEVERAARQVDVYAIRLLEFNLPCVTLDVECGRGVYMRSLAHDLGIALGCGGYVTDLERRYSAGFSSEAGLTLEALEETVPESGDGAEWLKHIWPLDHVLRQYRAITVSGPAERQLRNGQDVATGRLDLRPSYLEQFRAYGSDGRFVALVRHNRQANSWQPVKVFNLEEPSPYAGDSC